jgi:hypothetical protein
VKDESVRSLAICGATIVASLFGITWLYGVYYWLHHDLAGAVLTSALALELGDKFWNYSSYFVPVEYLWFAFAVRLGSVIGWGADAVVLAQTCFAVLLSASLGYRVRRVTVGATPWFFVVSYLALLVTPILSKNIFGLREPLIVLGLWPYLVLRASTRDEREVGLPLRTGLAVWLGFTLLFKFFYAVIVLLVEVTDALVQRRVRTLFRAENLIAGAIVLAYVGIWLGFHSEQRRAMSLMHGAISANLLGTEIALRVIAERLVLGLALFLIARRLGSELRLQLIAFATLVGALAAAWLQERWYTHHLFPITMAFMLWWWMAGPPWPKLAHAAFAAILALSIYREYRETRFYYTLANSVEAVFTHAKISLEGKRVALLNQHPSPYNQLLASKGALRWNPYPNIAYVSTELKSFDRPENRRAPTPPLTLSSPGSRLLHSQMLRLWQDYPPDILILDYSYSWPLVYIGVDWKRLLAKDEEFQKVFRNFSLAVRFRVPQMLTFEVYVRKKPQAASRPEASKAQKVLGTSTRGSETTVRVDR